MPTLRVLWCEAYGGDAVCARTSRASNVILDAIVRERRPGARSLLDVAAGPASTGRDRTIDLIRTRPFCKGEEYEGREMILEPIEAGIVVIASTLVAAGSILWRGRLVYLKAHGRRKHARMWAVRPGPEVPSRGA
jgi:hypothetical protein